MRAAAGHTFTEFPGLFWDTFVYVGILPLVAVVCLGLLCLGRRRWPESRWMFLALIGIVAILAALPLSAPLGASTTATIMRSPARLLYLYTFSVSAAFGAGIDAVLGWNPLGSPILTRALVLVCLAVHGWDLGGISRSFIVPVYWHPERIPEFEEILSREAGESRVAASVIVTPRLTYRYDSPGGYDSIFLAGPYPALAALSGLPPGYNEEHMDAGSWPPAALRATAARFLVAWQKRPDLDLVKTSTGLRMYRVQGSCARALRSSIERPSGFVPANQIPTEMKNEPETVGHVLLLPYTDENLVESVLAPQSNSIEGTSTALYLRPNSDKIVIRSASSGPGLVYVIEAADRGWAAEVDGMRTPILQANGLGMAIPVTAGKHEIVLRYRTPGRVTGAILSLISVLLLAALVRVS